MKTLTTGHKDPYTPFAIVELDGNDLRAIGISHRDAYGNRSFSGDPGKALKAIIDRDRQAAVKVIEQSGPMHVLHGALDRMKKYHEAVEKVVVVDPAKEDPNVR